MTTDQIKQAAEISSQRLHLIQNKRQLSSQIKNIEDNEVLKKKAKEKAVNTVRYNEGIRVMLILALECIVYCVFTVFFSDKIEISNYVNTNAMIYLFIGGIGLYIAHIFLITKLVEKRKVNKIAKVYRKLFVEYKKQQEEVIKYNDNIKSKVSEINNMILNLEERMTDRNFCCIHRDYWDAAPTLYRYLENGRATSYADAIRIYEEERRHNALIDEINEANANLTVEMQLAAYDVMSDIDDLKRIEGQKLEELREINDWIFI